MKTLIISFLFTMGLATQANAQLPVSDAIADESLTAMYANAIAQYVQITDMVLNNRIIADGVKLLSTIEGGVAGSLKLQEIFSLKSKTQSVIDFSRNFVTTQVYPATTTIISGSGGSNTVMSRTYSGLIFDATEQGSITSLLDMYSNNLYWQVFDLNNVFMQTITFTGSSSDRYRLIGATYDAVYKNYQDALKLKAQVQQTATFRKLQAAAQGVGGNTNISF